MHITTLAPYLIAYLLGVATPVVVALIFFRGQDRENENSCLLVGVLVFVFLAIVGLIVLWAQGAI